MIDLFRAEDDARIGQISEEAPGVPDRPPGGEDSEDTDYYVDHDTLEFLRGTQPAPGLIRLLESPGRPRRPRRYYYSQERPEQGARLLFTRFR